MFGDGDVRPVPVTDSDSPFPEGCEPLLSMSICFILLRRLQKQREVFGLRGAECLFCSEAGHSLQLFGIPIPLDRDRCNGSLDFLEIVGREMDGESTNILIQAF